MSLVNISVKSGKYKNMNVDINNYGLLTLFLPESDEYEIYSQTNKEKRETALSFYRVRYPYRGTECLIDIFSNEIKLLGTNYKIKHLLNDDFNARSFEMNDSEATITIKYKKSDINDATECWHYIFRHIRQDIKIKFEKVINGELFPNRTFGGTFINEFYQENMIFDIEKFISQSQLNTIKKFIVDKNVKFVWTNDFYTKFENGLLYVNLQLIFLDQVVLKNFIWLDILLNKTGISEKLAKIHNEIRENIMTFYYA